MYYEKKCIFTLCFDLCLYNECEREKSSAAKQELSASHC